MVKQLLKLVLVAFAFLLAQSAAYAQCANDNVLVAGSLTPPGVSLTANQVFFSGQYVLASVEGGANYTISTCSNSNFDSQITVYNNTTGALIAYNDDFCGLRSSVSFTPTTCGVVRVLLDQFFCTTGTSSMDVAMTMNTAGSGNPTLVSAADQNACASQPANIGISGNGSGGLPPYAYSWLPTTNLTTTTQANSTVTTVTTTTTYTLTITDANGCVDRDTVVVALLAAPPVTLGADTTLCATGFLLDAGNPGSSYLWSTGAGTQTLNITQSGTYSVAVQFPSGCINQDNITVNLITPPLYSVGADTTSCGANVLLDAGIGFTSYTWSTGGTGQTEPVATSGTFGVTVVDANGCVLSDSLVVTLSPAPSVNLGADTTQCGGTIALDAGNAGSLYFWSNSTSSQVATVSTSGTYFVNVLTTAGCSDADTISVTINNQPVVNLGPDTSICLTTLILDAGNPGSTYLWSNLATTQSVTVGSGTYSVVALDPSGCFDADTIAVTTNVPAVVTVSQDTAICIGGTATLTATGASSYLWSNNSTGQTIAVSPTTNTAYYATGTDPNGCQASDLVIVTILPASNAQFTSSLVGVTVSFVNQSTNATSYSWNFGDASPPDNTANPTHVYTVNGTYTVTLTVTGPCGTDTFTQVVTITQVGIQDNDIANTLSIYPNPNNGQFTVSFEFAEQKDVRVVLSDVSGRVISTIDQQNVSIFKQEMGEIDLANGVYFLNIATKDGVVTQKIVVQK